MKKSTITIILFAIILSILSVSCATKPIATEKYVMAIYTKEAAQPYNCTDGNKEQLDTIWIYYSDGTFVQYAEHHEELQFFSKGNYELINDDDFIAENETNSINIIINRDKKYQHGELADYASEHTYDLGTLGFEQIYAYTDNSKKIEAVFYGLDKQLYIEKDGDKELLDTIWIYYDDMTFDQFAIIDDVMQLFSTGDYQFEDGGDFIYEVEELNFGDITLNRHQKYSAGQGLVAHESTHTYDLNSLGFKAIVMPTV